MNTDEQGYEGSRLRDEQIRLKKKILRLLAKEFYIHSTGKTDLDRGVAIGIRFAMTIIENNL